MKRISKKDYERLQQLNALICSDIESGEHARTIWRGEMRAIQWAAWWIRETLEDDARKGQR